MCLSLFRGGKQGKQRSSWIKLTGSSWSCSYRECIKFRAFRACVSQRSVRASSSALSCSQVSLLGAPIKPASRESVFAEAQKGTCMALYAQCQRAPACVLHSHCPSLGPGDSLCHCHVISRPCLEVWLSSTILCSSASFPFYFCGMVQSSTQGRTSLEHLSWSDHKACMGSEQQDGKWEVTWGQDGFVSPEKPCPISSTWRADLSSN